MARPRIVFMGTPAFSVSSLEACLEVGDVVGVVTQPDRPKGRGQSLAVSPVKALALDRGIPVLQPAKLKTPPFALELAALEADVCVVTAYGRILPPDVLATPKRGCLNVHASLLPRWRGAAPIQWAVAAGDAETGVCLMQMDAGLDTGPVLARRTLPILAEDTSESLHEKLAALGGNLLREELPRYLEGLLKAQPQSSEGMTLAPMIEKEFGRLDFQKDARELERRVRAFYPWPGSFVQLDGMLLKVHRVRCADGVGTPGEILAVGTGLEVACSRGSLVLLEVQPEGKRRMSAQEFLQGRKLVPGPREWT